MPTLTIEEAQADLARVAEQVATAEAGAIEERRRVAEAERRAADERLRAVEAELQEIPRQMGAALRQLDDLIARIPPADCHWKPIVDEARTLRARLCASIQKEFPDEAWFWTESWQAGEREAEAQIAAGAGISFASDEAFFEYLDRLTGNDAHA